MDEAAIEKAAAQARRAALLALLCVMVAFAILFVDNQIKRHIVAKAGEARQYLDQFGAYYQQVMANGRQEQEAAADRGSGGAAGEPDERVGDAAAGREDVDSPVGEAVWEAVSESGGRAGGAGGPRGNA